MPDAFIAFFLPPAIAEQAALPGGEPAEKLHLTLAYIGDLDETDLSRLEEELALWAKYQVPIAGKISGVGRFSETGEEGRHAFYVSFDAPGLPRFRQALVEELNWLGCPADRTHGYTPHITLQYLDAGAPSPLASFEPVVEVTFDVITLVAGDRRIEYTLSGAPVEKYQAPDRWSFFAKVATVDDEQQIVYGLAATETPDDQAGTWDGRKYEGDIVSLEALEAALPDYLKWSNIREMHQASAVGTATSAEIKDGALHLAAKIVDREAWDKVRERVYRGFSIGGKVLKAKLVEIGGKIYRYITKLKLYEISLVDRPADQGAEILLWKFQQEGQMSKQTPKDPAAPEKPDLNRAEGMAGEEGAEESKDNKVVAMLQEMRDECERSRDMAGAARYSQAIALMIGEEAPVEAAEDEEEATGTMMGQSTGDLQKVINGLPGELAKAIQPKLDDIAGKLAKLGDVETRLANIEAQPAAGGPVLRPADKKLAGQDKPAPQAPAITKAQLNELKQRAATEPSPLLRAQYQQQYTQLLEELASQAA